MKTFKKFMVLLLVVCLLFSLSSCFFIAGKRSGSSSGGIFSSSTKNLVGSWQLVDGRTDIIAMTLYSDGTCTVANTGSRSSPSSSTAMFRLLLRMSGNGRLMSVTIGVSTG